jgi:beta-xylosidase
MFLPRSSFGLTFLCLAVQVVCHNKTYTNPILSGWHSDPSCVFVPEYDNTIFCTTSSLLSFPGCPISASKDLINWRLARNVVNREEQLPEFATTNNEQEGGFFASTLRFHNGSFYLISAWANPSTQPATETGWPISAIKLFTSTNTYDDGSWSVPLDIPYIGESIETNIFFDEKHQSHHKFAKLEATA